MKKIKIVTAFFDIGRGESGILPRSNERYLDYFRFWARIKNDLIIYCQPEYAERIFSIRAEYGLGEATEIVAIDDIYAIEPEMFERMLAVQNDESFRNFRFYNNAMENTARYNYIMMLKAWCLADAAKRTDEDCFIAWIDFGYGRAEIYADAEEFSFLWEYDFPEKINIFARYSPDRTSLIDSLQLMDVCFMGGAIVMPSDQCSEFWRSIRTCMDSLLNVGCMDDDQQLILMAYKRHPEQYNVISSDWFDLFFICSNRKLTPAEKPPRPSFLRRVLSKVKRRCIAVVAPGRVQTQERSFIQRMRERVKKYYG